MSNNTNTATNVASGVGVAASAAALTYGIVGAYYLATGDSDNAKRSALFALGALATGVAAGLAAAKLDDKNKQKPASAA